jgi:hypothetical protein
MRYSKETRQKEEQGAQNRVWNVPEKTQSKGQLW